MRYQTSIHMILVGHYFVDYRSQEEYDAPLNKLMP